jgi:hypothetical protein
VYAILYPDVYLWEEGEDVDVSEESDGEVLISEDNSSLV